MSTPWLASTQVPLALHFLPLDASTLCPTSFALQIQGASIYPTHAVYSTRTRLLADPGPSMGPALIGPIRTAQALSAGGL
jgi:hypothetical protein